MVLETRKIITMLIITIIAIIVLATFSTVKAKENTIDSAINIEYKYNQEENIVIAKIISDIELKNTKPTWTLSENKKEYTKKFTSNMNYKTQIEDINGNISNVNIVITQIQPLSIKINYEYDAEENIVIAKMTSNIELKNTKPSWT